VVTCRDASFVSSKGVRTRKLKMTDNLQAKNTGDWNKNILREIFYQAYACVLLATHNFGKSIQYILIKIVSCKRNIRRNYGNFIFNECREYLRGFANNYTLITIHYILVGTP